MFRDRSCFSFVAFSFGILCRTKQEIARWVRSLCVQDHAVEQITPLINSLQYTNPNLKKITMIAARHAVNGRSNSIASDEKTARQAK